MVGKTERITQNRVVKLFQQQLQYRYLGNWQDRENNSNKERASQLQNLGFASYDAAHIASAERAKADIFLTTDDRLIRKSQTYTQLLKIEVNNPLQWLTKIMLMEDNNDENSK